MPSSNYRAGARLRVPMQLPFVSSKDRFEKGKPNETGADYQPGITAQD